MRRSAFSVSIVLLGVSALAGVGCRRDEIRTYTIQKEPAPPPLASASSAPSSGAPALPPGHPSVTPAGAPAASSDATMRNTAVDIASGPSLAWNVPAGWTAGPERPMRKATLLLPGENGGPGAELSVTAFPGDVGGNLANVNRWRQQLSLPPIAQGELASALQHLEVGTLHVDLVELVGAANPPAAGQRVLGAIVPYAGATWFFKLTGPDARVAREKDSFLAFIRSLRPAS